MGYWDATLKPSGKAYKPYEVPLYSTREVITPESNVARTRASAPWWDAVNASAGQVAGRVGTDYGGDLIDQLTGQASDELALGGQLSPDEVRESTQGTRAAFQARGMMNSGAGTFAEVLNRMQYSNQRKDSRRAFAGQVAGMGLARRQADVGAMQTLTGASLAPAALSEEQRQFELQRSDSLRTADKQAALDLKIGKDSAAAAKKAQQSSIFGSVLGSVASIIPFL